LQWNKKVVDANTLLHYTNVFNAIVYAAYFAMAHLNVMNSSSWRRQCCGGRSFIAEQVSNYTAPSWGRARANPRGVGLLCG
jgi:hypothetical protein